jgi:hypothetical protein
MGGMKYPFQAIISPQRAQSSQSNSYEKYNKKEKRMAIASVAFMPFGVKNHLLGFFDILAGIRFQEIPHRKITYFEILIPLRTLRALR